MTAISSLFLSRSSNSKGNNRIDNVSNRRPVAAGFRRRRSTYGIFLALVALALTACTPGDLGQPTRGWAAAVASNGVVFVADLDGKVKALNDTGSPDSGTKVSLKWTFPSGEEELKGVYNTPVVGDRLIYIAAADGVLYAINKATGALEWQTTLADETQEQILVSGPVIDDREQMVIVGSDDNRLTSLDTSSGEINWQFSAGDKIWSTPVISGDSVYFGSHDQKVYSVDLASGEQNWEFLTNGAVVARPLVLPKPRGQGNMVVIGSFDRKLYAIDAVDGTPLDIEDGAGTDPGDGSLLWPFEKSSNWYWAGAVASNSAIYAPSMDGKVYAIDRSGASIWEHDMESPIVSTPVLLPRGLVVASESGTIRLLDLPSGEAINDLDISPAEVRSPLFALPDTEEGEQKESVFLGDKDDIVRRIDFKSGATIRWCFDTKDDQIYKEKGCPQ